MRALLGTYLLASFVLACSGNANSDAGSGGDDGSSEAQTGGTSSMQTGGSGGQNPEGSGGTGGTADRACPEGLSEANRALVAEALDKLFVDKDLSAIDEYWAEPYHQHNPVADSGVEAFREVMSSFVPSPSFSYERLRTLADCDLVVVQGRYSLTGVIFDMFRVQDGKIMEHWDSDMNQASNADGPSDLTDFPQTEANRARVLSFIERVLIDGDHASVTDHLVPSYVDRREPMSSGPNTLIDYLTSEDITYAKVHHVIADGNFVFTLSEGERAGDPYGFYDLFRLESGRIVERWDSRRAVPDMTMSGLPIF